MSLACGLGRAVVIAATCGALAVGTVRAAGVNRLTPDSPEVLQAIEKAVAFLASDAGKYGRLGGKALIGLVFLKSGHDLNHPRIQEGVKSICERVHARAAKELDLPVYDAGLAVIFLVTLDRTAYEKEIEALLAYLQSIQKPHGGWGYPDKDTGDTSMTQYGVLSCWEASQAGFRVPREMIESVTNWLLKTQDPSGAFGYQGTVSDGALVKQSGVHHSMAAAGLGSLYVCANLLGFSNNIVTDSDLPRVVHEVKVRQEAAVAPRVEVQRLRTSQSLGNRWMRGNFKVNPEQWPYYYLYALERYYSFREAAEGEKDSAWYSEGARHLLKNQQADGSWVSDKAGQAPIDTCFGALFLLRSAKKSIEHARYFHAGMLVAGQGLPHDTTHVAVSAGRVVPSGTAAEAAALLDHATGVEHPDFVAAVEMLAALPGDEARLLAQQRSAQVRSLALGGSSAEIRRAAVRALAHSGDLQQVPVLIGAVVDPDAGVGYEANQALRRISRKVAGFEMSNTPSLAERRLLRDQWKAWYLAICPDAEFPF